MFSVVVGCIVVVLRGRRGGARGGGGGGDGGQTNMEHLAVIMPRVVMIFY